MLSVRLVKAGAEGAVKEWDHARRLLASDHGASASPRVRFRKRTALNRRRDDQLEEISEVDA